MIWPIAATGWKYEFVARLKALGRVDEAIRWLKNYAAARATTVNDHTVGWVADLLEHDGRAPETLAWLQQWAAAGDWPALAQAVASLQAAGRSAEAIRWLAADGPSSPAGVELTRPLCRMSGLLHAAGHCSLALVLVQEAAVPLGNGERLLLWSAEAYVRSRADVTAAQAVQEWKRPAPPSTQAGSCSPRCSWTPPALTRTCSAGSWRLGPPHRRPAKPRTNGKSGTGCRRESAPRTPA